MDHLTESEIQDYLDGNLHSDETNVKFHLDTCNSCSAQLEQYRTLFSDLSEDLPILLSEDFADTIISKVTEKYKSSLLSFDVFMVLAGMFSSFGMLFYYFKSGLSFQSLSGVYAWFETLLPVYTQLKTIVTMLSTTGFTTILFGALVLLIMGAVDRFVVKNYFRRLKVY